MDYSDAPAEALLGTVVGNPNVAPGVWTKRLWMDSVTENRLSARPKSGSCTTPPPTPTRCTSMKSSSRWSIVSRSW